MSALCAVALGPILRTPVDLMLCCGYLGILDNFSIRGSAFSFLLGPTNYIACPAWM